MKNIDRIRSLSKEELAKFLTNSGAETPLDFYEGCENYKGGSHDCRECSYSDDEAAWNAWLERETPEGQEENKCLERSYTAMMNDLYGIPTKKQDEMFNTKEIFGTPLAAVEQAINFKLYRWVKEYLITGNDELRQTGMTTARHLRMLLTDAPNKTYNLSRGLSQTVSRFEFEMRYLRALKQRLAAAGIKTNTIKITGWHGTNYTEVL